jgi:16S rRNA (cytosine1407-C5)-methyltransferase
VARSFRLVCDGPEIPLVEDLLRSQGFCFEPEPFSPWCRVLAREPFPLGASLAARFGLLYIQDRSSMLPPLALAPEAGAAVLDMCASPGGKTSFLAQLTGLCGYVLGNEPSADRLATLRQNLARLNLPQAVATGMKGQDLPLPDGSLGAILLDPPCSGWGTAEKNPKVLTLWKPGKAAPLIALQRELLAKAARLLGPGGRMLYSTCTTNVAENEDQALWAREELGLEIAPIPPFAGFSFHDPERPGAEGTLRVDGEGSEAQGFYLALLVKPGGEGAGEAREVSGGPWPFLPVAPDPAGGGHQGAGAEAPLAQAPARDGRPRPGPARQAGRAKARSGGRFAEEELGAGRKGRRDEAKGAPGKKPGAEWIDGVSDPRPDDPELAWENLPPGHFEIFKDEVCFIPARGEGLLPPRRKGQRLGSLKGGMFRPWARARILVPKPGLAEGVHAASPGELAALLEGRGIGANVKCKRLALYYRGLPLGFLTVKGGRALWSDR